MLPDCSWWEKSSSIMNAGVYGQMFWSIEVKFRNSLKAGGNKAK